MAKPPKVDELAEAKRIAARMLATPPDPKKAKPPKKAAGKSRATEGLNRNERR